uniref:Uncharacterized protein n=1 Tax=Panagrolaimus davidi TaxID=227884 RepID=A0A914PAM8_9BILA
MAKIQTAKISADILQITSTIKTPKWPPASDRVRLTQNFVHQIFSPSNAVVYRTEELPNNLGISGTLYIREKNLLSQFISKCVLCDLKCVFFTNDYWINEKISYDDFTALTSSGRLEKLGLGNTIATLNNGEIVPYESLLEHTPALRCLCLKCNQYLQLSQKFMEKICASNLEKFTVFQLPVNFETKAFLANMAKKKPQLRVRLFFK